MKKIIMPKGGQTTDSSTIVSWKKQVGDSVELGDVLFEIETDKAVLEIESFGSGILLERYYEEGDSVETGAVVCLVGQPGENDKTSAEAAPAEAPEKKPAAKPAAAFRKQTAPLKPRHISGGTGASPAARRLIKELGLDIAAISAFTGGVIHKNDVAEYLAAMKQPAVQEKPAVKEPVSLREWQSLEPADSIRRATARRLTESVRNAPQYFVAADIDMTEAIAFREKLKEAVKISYNDLIIKCACRAIEKYPLVNCFWSEDGIIANRQVNFGVAVSTSAGLLVPVLKNADKLSLGEIAKGNADNISEARTGKVSPELLQDGTITISNLGMMGTPEFTAILNPPQSCILAVGKTEEKCIPVNGEIKIRPVMRINATFDHRLIDGAYGAEFMKELKLRLENPSMLAL